MANSTPYPKVPEAVRMGFLKTRGFRFPEGLCAEESRTVKRSMGYASSVI